MKDNDQKCEDCIYWVLENLDNEVGICKRYPATAYASYQSHNNWCGEFKSE